MTDFHDYDDEDEGEGQDAARRRVMHRIRTEGVEAATEAGIRILKDSKASAQAQTAAMNAMYRAAGYFDKDAGDGSEEPIELTVEQNTKMLNAAKREFLRLEALRDAMRAGERKGSLE